MHCHLVFHPRQLLHGHSNDTPRNFEEKEECIPTDKSQCEGRTSGNSKRIPYTSNNLTSPSFCQKKLALKNIKLSEDLSSIHRSHLKELKRSRKGDFPRLSRRFSKIFRDQRKLPLVTSAYSLISLAPCCFFSQVPTTPIKMPTIVSQVSKNNITLA